jgi:hypothetical protein
LRLRQGRCRGPVRVKQSSEEAVPASADPAKIYPLRPGKINPKSKKQGRKSGFAPHCTTLFTVINSVFAFLLPVS